MPRLMRLAEVARIRQVGYRLFSAALLYPDRERLETLRAVAQELQSRTGRLARFAFFPQWSRFVQALAGCPDMGASDLAERYVRLFVVSADGLCPPYASHYLAPGVPAQVMAEVEGAYARAGLTVAAALNEAPDHAAVELEFMGLLCAEEAEAWSERRPDDALRRLAQSAAFLEDHLCRWFPGFCARVATQDDGGLYSLATGAAGAFIVHDLDLSGALLRRYGEPASA